jgi:integrase
VVAKFIPVGRRNYYLSYYVDGKEERISTRTANENAAERIRAKVEVELAEGRFLDRKTLSDLTLEEFGRELYLPRMEKARPRSIRWRRERWRQVLRMLGKDMELEAIDLSTLDAYVPKRLEDGVSIQTVKQEIAVLRHALGQAWRWRRETGLSEFRVRDWRPPDELGYGGADPKAVPVDPKAWSRILKWARIRAVRKRANPGAEARKWADVQGMAVLLLGRTLGARKNEILGLQRGDVDLKRGVVRRQVLKRRSWVTREARVSGEALAWLRRAARLHSYPLLFANPETGAPRHDIAAFWNWVRRKAKAHPRFHNIRHSYGRDLLASGKSLRELQDRLAHSSIRTTEAFYAHWEKDREIADGIPIE